MLNIPGFLLLLSILFISYLNFAHEQPQYLKSTVINFCSLTTDTDFHGQNIADNTAHENKNLEVIFEDCSVSDNKTLSNNSATIPSPTFDSDKKENIYCVTSKNIYLNRGRSPPESLA